MYPKIVVTIPLHDNAKDLWDYLERGYCVANEPRIQQICRNHGLQKNETMTVDAYYTKLMRLFDELARLKLLPTCERKKYECGMSLKFSKDRDDEIFQ